MYPILSLRHYSHDALSHSHDHAQLVFGLTGELQFEVEGQGSRVSRHHLAVVPPEARHTCASPRGSQCLVLDLPANGWLEQQLGHHASHIQRLLDKPQALQLDAAQGQLLSWLAASPINDAVIAGQGAALLLGSLACAQPRMPAGGLPLTMLQRHIEQHAAHPLQVADLAHLAGLSVARFHARFLAETGRTPMEHIRDTRLHLAERLLHSSDLAVGEVAARVGYASQSAFTAALSRYRGVTPRQLRRTRETLQGRL
ncbi:MAG: AraC family transcriptional regulator [Gammaproteobacteria bacterium]|nr:AraC family transcriptional regulator [Gammaproteobacteria bacterium]MBU2064386.1 AraC family transcriptional regulator [Gammaproteobacteria bacterium]MBU2138192.1 AraC family transcriptional regulator [Gammaproteobacteria bacterium]MBU2217919.1 AraC family transcriptional regulator [Gammaproteobacteria bacterium]